LTGFITFGGLSADTGGGARLKGWPLTRFLAGGGGCRRFFSGGCAGWHQTNAWGSRRLGAITWHAADAGRIAKTWHHADTGGHTRFIT
jgi:hypothetical protein